MSLRFFTDITTNASNYCLLHASRYHDKRKTNKLVVYVDPGVYYLNTGATEYKDIDLLHELAGGATRDNEWVSIDYPCDMNLNLQDYFVRKSVENNFKYARNDKYICTIQYRFADKADFVRRFTELEHVWQENPRKIIGLGNLCRIMRPTSYLNTVFRIVHERVPPGTRIHVYGAALSVIREYFPRLCKRYDVSVDSTKWTRAVDDAFKLANGVAARSHNRDKYLHRYMDQIRSIGLEVEY